ncbi:MAG: response regulator [Methanobacteriota archaeon]
MSPPDPLPTERRPQTVLLVDDERDILESLGAVLEHGLKDTVVMTAESGAGALEILARHPVDLIVTDYKMPGMNGIEFLAKARVAAPGVPRILVTAYPDLDLAIRAINDEKIENFLTKPFRVEQALEVIQAVLSERRARELRDRSFARSLDQLRKRLAEGPR